jgi:hypothetical protein
MADKRAIFATYYEYATLAMTIRLSLSISVGVNPSSSRLQAFGD